MDTTPTLRLAALFEAGRTQLIERYGGRLQALLAPVIFNPLLPV